MITEQIWLPRSTLLIVVILPISFSSFRVFSLRLHRFQENWSHGYYLQTRLKCGSVVSVFLFWSFLEVRNVDRINREKFLQMLLFIEEFVVVLHDARNKGVFLQETASAFNLGRLCYDLIEIWLCSDLVLLSHQAWHLCGSYYLLLFGHDLELFLLQFALRVSPRILFLFFLNPFLFDLVWWLFLLCLNSFFLLALVLVFVFLFFFFGHWLRIIINYVFNLIDPIGCLWASAGFFIIFVNDLEPSYQVPIENHFANEMSCLLCGDLRSINSFNWFSKELTDRAHAKKFHQFVHRHLGHFAETGHTEDSQLFVFVE